MLEARSCTKGLPLRHAAVTGTGLISRWLKSAIWDPSLHPLAEIKDLGPLFREKRGSRGRDRRFVLVSKVR